MISRILIATHGTKGAVKAEEYALGLAQKHCAELHAVYVIHGGWGSLVGIEWLHSSEKRMDFYRYAEAELFRMADEALAAFTRRAADAGVVVSTAVRVGEPGEVIVSEARERGSDLIIIGDACKGRSETYKASVSVKKLLRSAPCSVLQVKAPSRIERAASTDGASACCAQGAAAGSAARR